MTRYIFNEKIGVTYNASSKARDDVAYFVSTYKDKDGNKYTVLGNNDKSKVKTKAGKILVGIFALVKLSLQLRKDDVLFIQSSFKVLEKINIIKKVCKFKTICLVHDIDSLRDNYDDIVAVGKEIDILNNQDVVILHNEKMKDELIKRGCKAQLVSIEIFDYSTDANIKDHCLAKAPIEICFAGNLNPNKTGFLYLLDEKNTDYVVNIYGRLEKAFNRLNYCGCYPPEQLPEILEGQFGLIWEGNEFTYDEKTHPYIMLNNPHKASLYIVSGIPIIVWEKAAIATFVKKEKIGLTINSLEELKDKLYAITPQDYYQMHNNIMRIRCELINGAHIHSAIQEAEKILNI